MMIHFVEKFEPKDVFSHNTMTRRRFYLILSQTAKIVLEINEDRKVSFHKLQGRIICFVHYRSLW